MFGLQDINIDLDFVRNGMARGQVFILDQDTTARAVKFNQPAKVRIKSKTVFLVLR
jgi:hypothetical protein